MIVRGHNSTGTGNTVIETTINKYGNNKKNIFPKENNRDNLFCKFL
jgi:hypothetical protein